MIDNIYESHNKITKLLDLCLMQKLQRLQDSLFREIYDDNKTKSHIYSANNCLETPTYILIDYEH